MLLMPLAIQEDQMRSLCNAYPHQAGALFTSFRDLMLCASCLLDLEMHLLTCDLAL